MEKKDVEEDVVKNILKECNLFEKIIVRMFEEKFVKVYKMGITYGFNGK